MPQVSRQICRIPFTQWRVRPLNTAYLQSEILLARAQEAVYLPEQQGQLMSKVDALRDDGTLNPRAEVVTDPNFTEGGFFDPRDVVQVKYEMLRRARVEAIPVTRAVQEAGFSRQTFYKAKADFEEAGIAGLVPKKRGPRGPHKLQGDILEFMKATHNPGQPIRAAWLATEIAERFGVQVHPRSIERALRNTQKKTE